MRTVPRALVLSGLMLAIGLVAFAAPFASSEPDGLERVAEEQGFADEEKDHALSDAPVSDYKIDGVRSPGISQALTGAIGVCLTFVIGYGLFTLLRRRSRSSVQSQVGRS